MFENSPSRVMPPALPLPAYLHGGYRIGVRNLTVPISVAVPGEFGREAPPISCAPFGRRSMCAPATFSRFCAQARIRDFLLLLELSHHGSRAACRSTPLDSPIRQSVFYKSFGECNVLWIKH